MFQIFKYEIYKKLIPRNYQKERIVELLVSVTVLDVINVGNGGEIY